MVLVCVYGVRGRDESRNPFLRSAQHHLPSPEDPLLQTLASPFACPSSVSAFVPLVIIDSLLESAAVGLFLSLHIACPPRVCSPVTTRLSVSHKFFASTADNNTSD